MDLIAAIQTVVKNQLKGAALTDLSVGTVTGIDPLEVTLQASKLTVSGEALLLTGAVIEKKIESEKHCIENGAALPLEGGYAILNRGLEPGDRVLLLRVMAGQRFVVLSRVY